tara:strand:+ start:2674 stop:3504 length:831 start_codon:yes stop_codon:yes gene_type:complete
MPGTGHSARYKGSISNRSKISPFEHLAKWNQQLLGADGAVPSIVGGNSLEFKKLDATNIAGVMHNPAIADLNMYNFNITNCTQLNTTFISNLQSISAANTVGLNIQSANGGGINMTTSGSNPKINMTIFSSSPAAPSPLTSQDIKIGYFGGNAWGRIKIGWDNNSTGNNDIFIGNGNTTASQKKVFIMADTFSGGGFSSLIMGNANLTNASLSSLATGITGVNTLKLSGGGITIGAATSRLGFFGLTPTIIKPTGVAITANAIHAALKSLGLIDGP